MKYHKNNYSPLQFFCHYISQVLFHQLAKLNQFPSPFLFQPLFFLNFKNRYNNMLNIGKKKLASKGKGGFLVGKFHGRFFGNFRGKGKFVSDNGTTYEGDFVNGKMQGEGKFVLADGSYLEGDWVDSELIRGRYYNEKSELLYEIPKNS